MMQLQKRVKYSSKIEKELLNMRTIIFIISVLVMPFSIIDGASITYCDQGPYADSSTRKFWAGLTSTSPDTTYWEGELCAKSSVDCTSTAESGTFNTYGQSFMLEYKDWPFWSSISGQSPNDTIYIAFDKHDNPIISLTSCDDVIYKAKNSPYTSQLKNNSKKVQSHNHKISEQQQPAYKNIIKQQTKKIHALRKRATHAY